MSLPPSSFLSSSLLPWNRAASVELRRDNPLNHASAAAAVVVNNAISLEETLRQAKLDLGPSHPAQCRLGSNVL